MQNTFIAQESTDNNRCRSVSSIVETLQHSFAELVVNQCPTHVKMKLRLIEEGSNPERVTLNQRETNQILAHVVSQVNEYKTGLEAL
jgi:hypothetical protein